MSVESNMRSTLAQSQTRGNVDVSKLDFGLPVARRPSLRFDLVDLRLFLHVAEAQTITHGAERSNLALASASARIRGMEVALGTVCDGLRLGAGPSWRETD